MTGEASLPLLMEPFLSPASFNASVYSFNQEMTCKELEDIFVLEAYLFFTPSFAYISVYHVPLFSHNIVLFKIMCHLPISTVPIEKTEQLQFNHHRRRTEKLHVCSRNY